MNHYLSNNEQLHRDSSSNALINKNAAELERYKAKRKNSTELSDIKFRLKSIEQRLERVFEVLSIEG